MTFFPNLVFGLCLGHIVPCSIPFSASISSPQYGSLQRAFPQLIPCPRIYISASKTLKPSPLVKTYGFWSWKKVDGEGTLIEADQGYPQC